MKSLAASDPLAMAPEDSLRVLWDLLGLGPPLPAAQGSQAQWLPTMCPRRSTLTGPVAPGPPPGAYGQPVSEPQGKKQGTVVSPVGWGARVSPASCLSRAWRSFPVLSGEAKVGTKARRQAPPPGASPTHKKKPSGAI